MILYIDTSALVPLLIEEPASGACGELWDDADNIVGTRLAYIEAAAALAQGERMGRVSADESRRGRAVLEELWPVVNVLELDQHMMADAAELAQVHGLRGYDATHCAAAVAVRDPRLVAASGDGRLVAAWRAEGIATSHTTK